MIRYEVLMLAVPEITTGESSALETQLRNIVREHGGNCLSFERWGKYKLAYPVKKNEYGVYFLVRFEVTQESLQATLKSVRALLSFKYNEIISRYIFDRLSSASLEYQRPESLEEVPGRTTDSLLREHRVDAGSYEGRAASRNRGAVAEESQGVVREEEV